jgi:signal peptidase II
MPLPPKARYFWPIFISWLLLDIVTKQLALANLWPPGIPHPVVGDYVRFTLAFNRGAAMGMSLGEWSRPAFTIIAIVLLGAMGWLYRRTDQANRLQGAILAFIAAGAVGNLIDRVRHARGVTDFIDLGVGSVRFWTFNVADMGITLGAIALALTMKDVEESRRESKRVEEGSPST